MNIIKNTGSKPKSTGKIATQDGWCGKEEAYHINFVQILTPMTRNPMVQQIHAPRPYGSANISRQLVSIDTAMLLTISIKYFCSSQSLKI